jgi:hypothetical protein
MDLGVRLRARQFGIGVRKDELGHRQPPARAISPETSSASTMAGSDPPSRRGVTYRVTVMVLGPGTANCGMAGLSFWLFSARRPAAVRPAS